MYETQPKPDCKFCLYYQIYLFTFSEKSCSKSKFSNGGFYKMELKVITDVSVSARSDPPVGS